MNEQGPRPDTPGPATTALDDAAIVAAAGARGLSARYTDRLRAAAASVRADDELARVLVAAHTAMTHDPADSERAFPAVVTAVARNRSDAEAEDLLDAVRGLLVLDTIRVVTQRQGARGVPQEVTTGMFRRHPYGWLAQADAALAGDGPKPAFSAWWWAVVASGTLYRVGRLEIHPRAWPHPFRWYRRRDGAAGGDPRVLIAEGGLRVTDDGWLAGRTTWTTTFSDDGAVVVGHPVSAAGALRRAPVRLRADTWERVLGPGDAALDLHIPEGPRLSLPELGESLGAAERFMDRYHPRPAFRAYMCASWMFGPQWGRILGPDATLVRWQRAGTLFPDDASDAGVLTWVFGAPEIDPDDAPRDTRLRRGVLDLLARGEPLRSGRWVLGRDQLGTFPTS